MSIVWRTIGSAVLAVGFLFLVGYFEFRAQMHEMGLVLTWDLLPSHVTMQQIAVLERVCLFVVFGAVAFLFLIRRRGQSHVTSIPALVGGLILAIVTGWFMATVEHTFRVPVEMNESGQEFGWSMVFETGALSSMAHGMAALLLVIVILTFAQSRRQQKPAPVDATSG